MKEIIWDSGEAERALGAASSGKWQASGISIDTRTLESGDLFVALKGDNNDGHKYLNDAVKRGASAALVNSIPDDFNNSIPVIIVPDSLDGLVQLAENRRKNVAAKIIGITGSVGKTSVKEGASSVLSEFGKTHTSEGNLNNHIGLPLSLARMPRGCNFGVFELGMSGVGEISYLSKILQPDIGVITNIRPMHLEFFNSVEEIANAKSEIFEGMKNDGVAILPKDDNFFEILSNNASSRNINNTLTFGSDNLSSILLKKNNFHDNGQELSVQYQKKSFKYSLPVFGDHHAINSAIIFAVCAAAGVDLDRAIKLISKLEPLKGRGKIYLISYKGKKLTVIDDSYNAGPDSMNASFGVLQELKKQRGGRAVALLGDMLELGEKSKEFHESLAEGIKSSNLDMIFTSGAEMKNLTNVLDSNVKGGNYDSPKDILPKFEKYVADGDIVLVKGSNGSRMWELIEIFVSR